jgi:hypothetical protein
MSWWDNLNDIDQNITEAIEGVNESLGWDNFMNRGIITTGFQPYVALFGDFFFGLLLGAIGIALYSWKENIYYLVGYLVAVMILARVIVPATFADMFSLILGLAISALVYQIYVRRKTSKERARK